MEVADVLDMPKPQKNPVGCIIHFNFPQKYNFPGKPLLSVRQV